MGIAAENARFAQVAVPHMDAAYNLARWLTRDPADAADVVQEAMMRALRFFGSYRGDNGKAWLLAIVRNTAFSWMKANRPAEILSSPADDAPERAIEAMPSPDDDPETMLIRAGEKRRLDALIAALPAEFRECLVLREIEELSYKEIASVTGVPIGTVMSRLARARRIVQRAWIQDMAEEGI